VPEKYRGIGVRIEDDVLVTEKGMKNLSASIPSEADDVEAWIAFQRHALLADDPGAMAQKSGLTPGDEVRLARLWRSRLALPEVAARAEAAMSGPLSPLPKLSLAPFAFPPSMEST